MDVGLSSSSPTNRAVASSGEEVHLILSVVTDPILKKEKKKPAAAEESYCNIHPATQSTGIRFNTAFSSHLLFLLDCKLQLFQTDYKVFV